MLKTQPFSLDPRIESDSLPVADLSICTCRLSKDSRWPWLILVPRIDGIEELFELSETDRMSALADANHAAEALKRITNCTKINIAMIGNIVRQLHIHVVARIEGDANWPGPIWGYGSPAAYEDNEAQGLISKLEEELRAQIIH